jgi:tripartite ATP-independent transporter DctM subunit
MMVTPFAGLLGVAVLVVALVAGIPIGVALGLTGLVGLACVLGIEPALIKSGVLLFDTLSRYELGVLPLFLLMAHLCFQANASRDFFDAAARLVGHRRGGLAIAAIGGCAGFGTISGSSLATTATIGLVAIPEMRQRGYAVELATGAVAAGGTLGQMVPPSGALIVYGIIAEQSIGRLFTAALLPALTQICLYCVVIVVWCFLRPGVAPSTMRATWPQRLAALRRIIDIGVLIAIVIGGIALGWFTPPEAASVGVVGAVLLCAFRRRLSGKALRTAVLETLRTSGMIYAVIVGALIFSVFISITGLAEQVAALLGATQANQVLALLAIAAILLLLGSILDGLALMLLTTPIFLPVIQHMGLSPIWFGVFLVRAMEIGFVHPPIGMNLFIIQNIDREVRIGQIFRGVLPFLAADFVHLLLLIFVPALALALPKALGI